VDALRYANLTLRFALELAALAALGYWGFAEHDGAAAILLGLGAPGLAALVWGLFVAPKAAVDLPPGGRLSCEVVVFAAAVCALWASDHTGPAVAMALAASVSRATGLRSIGYAKTPPPATNCTSPVPMPSPTQTMRWPSTSATARQRARRPWRYPAAHACQTR